MMKYLPLHLWILVLCSCSRPVYLSTSFHEPATAGLRFICSRDGYHWKDLGATFLIPAVGQQRVLRDPSIAQGPDGVYHLVWTCSWKGEKGFGYASSRDLVHWSPQQLINVMENEPETVNVWAPEIHYDQQQKQFIIIWASTIPHRFPKGTENEDNNHRMYVTVTSDFKYFSPAKLFFDPGYSVIDAVIVERNAHNNVLIFKDNTRAERNLKVAFSDDPIGAYRAVSAPFSGHLTEGPTVLKLDGQWLVYCDAYGGKRYAAYATRDFKSFEDISGRISLPEGHKHGTVFRSSSSILKGMQKAAVNNK